MKVISVLSHTIDFSKSFATQPVHWHKCIVTLKAEGKKAIPMRSKKILTWANTGQKDLLMRL